MDYKACEKYKTAKKWEPKTKNNWRFICPFDTEEVSKHLELIKADPSGWHTENGVVNRTWCTGRDCCNGSDKTPDYLVVDDDRFMNGHDCLVAVRYKGKVRVMSGKVIDDNFLVYEEMLVALGEDIVRYLMLHEAINASAEPIVFPKEAEKKVRLRKE